MSAHFPAHLKIIKSCDLLPLSLERSLWLRSKAGGEPTCLGRLLLDELRKIVWLHDSGIAAGVLGLERDR